MVPALVVLLGSFIVIGLFVASNYNALVTLKNRFQNAFSQIDVQLKRRYDLIPNLVETAKGYMAHDDARAGDRPRSRAMTALEAPPRPSDAGAMRGWRAPRACSALRLAA